MRGTTRDVFRLRPARGSEAGALSAVALRSKAHWPYSADFIDACRAELTWSTAQIESDRLHFVVAAKADVVCGFCALAVVDEDVAELEALFVDPAHMGQGLGGQLWRHAVGLAQERGIATMTIQSDPHAESFYMAMGAVTTGTKPSGSVPGRVLPLMQFCVLTPRA